MMFNPLHHDFAWIRQIMLKRILSIDWDLKSDIFMLLLPKLSYSSSNLCKILKVEHWNRCPKSGIMQDSLNLLRPHQFICHIWNICLFLIRLFTLCFWGDLSGNLQCNIYNYLLGVYRRKFLTSNKNSKHIGFKFLEASTSVSLTLLYICLNYEHFIPYRKEPILPLKEITGILKEQRNYIYGIVSFLSNLGAKCFIRFCCIWHLLRFTHLTDNICHRFGIRHRFRSKHMISHIFQPLPFRLWWVTFSETIVRVQISSSNSKLIIFVRVLVRWNESRSPKWTVMMTTLWTNKCKRRCSACSERFWLKWWTPWKWGTFHHASSLLEGIGTFRVSLFFRNKHHFY